MYAATYRKYTADGNVGPLIIEEFSTYEAAEQRCFDVFPLASMFAVWIRLESGRAIPVVYTQPSDICG